MTRDSASAPGPETDSDKDVTDSPEATEKTSADDTVKTPASATGTVGKSDEARTVAVDTTDDSQDTTDEGADEGTAKDPAASPAAAAVPASSSSTSAKDADLTLKPLPGKGAEAESAEATDGTASASDVKPVSGKSETDATATSTSTSTEKAAAATSAAVPVAAAATAPTATPTTPASSTPASSTSPSATTPSPDEKAEVPADPEGTGPSPELAEDDSTHDAPADPVTPEPEKHSTLFPLLGTLVALAALAAIFLGAMALPIAKATPNAVPVGVAGTDEITGQLTTLMQQFGGEGTFEIHQYGSQNALKTAIEDRDVYGGLFVDTTQAQMMIATAAGIEVSDALQTVANALQTQAQAQVTVTDVVAQPDEDPRGDGLSATELPLALVSVLPALALILLYRRRPLAQIGGAILASAAVGLAVAAVLNYGSGSTSGGNYWLLAAGLAAGFFATSIILLGLNAIGGRIGLGIGLAVFILLGAPLSGLSSVPEWLPDPWGTIGQMLPQGATATVLRSMAFFDAQGSKSALLVMIMWTAIGLLLLGLGTLLHRSNQRLAELKAEEAELDATEDKTPATV
ncbi:hypothetical protein KIH74_20450 [Kineosporia sp. J2-2]|uniref:ABC transporter permease n=1 Tax=Kineosporia corallincola TaxID=2835133 RepID=A0ABS5TJQ1_9ACTN|nr:hypothetical protein [Kineosporia corallincola]MBT0771320.1 hypothetical protein [Kineosporia corallincola]